MTTLPLKNINRIQTEDFDLSLFDPITHFPACGGTGIFVGSVRNHHEGRSVIGLEYTAYAPLAEKMIAEIENEVCQKYAVDYVRVVHRIGRLDVTSTAIIAVAYAAHRREAFAACEEAVERVKHEVPVWKEEFYQDGSSQFVTGCCIRKDLPAAASVPSPACSQPNQAPIKPKDQHDHAQHHEHAQQTCQHRAITTL